MINVKIDSRKVEKGDIFVAIKGHTVDGHDFIDVAIKNGASKIVCEKNIECDVETLVVEDSNKWLVDYIVSNYSSKVNEMNIVGVTGTNGKTTTCFLTYELLNEMGIKTAYIGTIGFYLPGQKPLELPNTTPNILDLYELLLSAKEDGCQTAVMEASSHALCQDRVKGLVFKTSAFTNLTEDHLDYHKTMEEYLKAKLLILKQTTGILIANSDDEVFGIWRECYENVLSYGYSGDLKILDFEDTQMGMDIIFEYQGNKYKAVTRLKSQFNVYNYLTCLGICLSLGIDINEIIKYSEKIMPPRGRCEQIDVNGGYAVIDYAHTPDAVLKIISAFAEKKKGKIITIIGCGGDRDKLKRPIMGDIATKHSDYVIFTSDNPRTEKPEDILNDIVCNLEKDNFEIEIDRKLAIVKGLDMLNESDYLLILGKGHEDYQIIGHEKIHLDDKEEVLNYLSSHK